MNRSLYHEFGKRLLDIVGAGVLLILLLPLMLVLAFIVKVGIGSPVLFRQSRPGKNGEPFTLFKFRTMTSTRDADGELRPDSERLTRLGRFLRSCSLDELPELWNVLRGDMSLVGPRPLLPEYLELYTDSQRRRHERLPGITGWAQVTGRNAISWQEKFDCDVWYVDNCNFWLDCRILILTIGRVLARSGIHAVGHETSSKFVGTDTPALTVRDHPIPRDAVVVVGGGGHALVVIATLQACGRRVAAIFDDRSELWGSTLLGVPVVGPVSELNDVEDLQGVLAIGDNSTRQKLAQRLRLTWVTAIHPRSVVHESATIEAGSVVFAGAIVQPLVRIGEHTIINTGATIDHECQIGDAVHIAPGAHLAGNVKVGMGAFLGIGSQVIPGVNIGTNTVVGAGAVVINDLPEGVTAIGCPARILSCDLYASRAA